MIYTIKKIYQFTETVEVVADNERDAKNIADRTAGDRNYDDHLVDCVVIDRQEQAGETL